MEFFGNDAFLVIRFNFNNFIFGYGNGLKKNQKAINSFHQKLTNIKVNKQTLKENFVLFEFLHHTLKFKNRLVNGLSDIFEREDVPFSYIALKLEMTTYNFASEWLLFKQEEETTEEKEEKNKVTFDDVYCLDDVVSCFKEVGNLLKNYKSYQKKGINAPYGMLLCGAPGCGKTLVSQAFINEFNFPVYRPNNFKNHDGKISYERLFANARNDKPSVVLLDELDKEDKIPGELSHEMNGQIENEGVLVIACVNRIDEFPPALLRPGRFDRKIFFQKLSSPILQKMLEKYLVKSNTKYDFDMTDLSEIIGNVNGSFINTYVNEAKIIMDSKGLEVLDIETMLQAIENVNDGFKEKELLNNESIETVIYHEAGHALVSLVLDGPNSVVQINAKGHTTKPGFIQTKNNDNQLDSKQDYEHFIKIALAGVVAEKYFLNKVTNGSYADLRKATRVAREMILSLGFDKLSDVIDGAYVGFMDDNSPEASKSYIVDKCKTYIDEYEEEIKTIFNENETLYFALVAALKEKPVLFKSDILGICNELGLISLSSQRAQQAITYAKEAE